MKKTKWLWAIVAAQALFLLGWAGWHSYVRATAPVIRLTTRPVDPRDILRGDYMILSYDISRHAAPAGWKAHETATAYVLFKIVGDYAVIDEIRHEAPPPSETRLWVEATAWSDGWDGSNVAGQAPAQTLRLTYGIEQFFVPEGKGRPAGQHIEVDASVSATHALYIRRLLVGGQPYP